MNETREFRSTHYLHCAKSVQMRSNYWSVFSRIWTRNYSVFGHFSRCVNSSDRTQTGYLNLQVQSIICQATPLFYLQQYREISVVYLRKRQRQPSGYSTKKAVLKNFVIFTGKHLNRSL